MLQASKALDAVSVGEWKAVKLKGYEPMLTNSRWLLLKRTKGLTDRQGIRPAEFLQYSLRSARAYLLKEELQFSWSYASPL